MFEKVLFPTDFSEYDFTDRPPIAETWRNFA